jgi:hypothetical protein
MMAWLVQVYRRIRSVIAWVGSPRPHRLSAKIRLRRQIAAVVLLALLSVLTAGYWYFTGDERVRQQVVRSLQQITGGEVELGQASLDILREIRIQSLRVYVPKEPHVEQNLVFSAQEVLLEHEPWSIISHQLQLRTIKAWEARLKIRYNRDLDQTNLQLLNIEVDPRGLLRKPKIFLRDGMVEYQEIAQKQLSNIVRQKISGSLFPDPASDHVYQFELNTTDEGFVKQSSLKGSYDFATHRAIQTTGNFFLEMIDVSNLPERVEEWRRLYEVSQPTGEVMTETRYDSQTGYSMQITLRDGSLRLPLSDVSIPLQQVNAKILCVPDHIEFEYLSGRYQNYCRFDGRGRIDGYDIQSAIDLNIAIEGFDILPGYWTRTEPAQAHARADATATESQLVRLLERLPVAIRKMVRDYAPTGKLDAQLRIQRPRGPEAQSRYTGTILCRDVGMVFREFPYPLSGIQGSVRFEPDNVILGPLTMRQNGQEIDISGYWKKESGEDQYDIKISSRHTPLDDRLYQALSAEHKRLWDAVTPTGAIDSVYQVTQSPGQAHHNRLDIQLNNVRAAWKSFPVILNDMQGALTWQQDTVSFHVDRAKAGPGTVSLDGTITHLSHPDPDFSCTVKFDDLLLDETLIGEFPTALQKQIHRAGLRGIASGDARIWQTPEDPSPPSRAGSELNQNGFPINLHYSVRSALKGGRIKPESIDYELTDVEAQGEWTDQQLVITSFDGRNGSSRVNAEGSISTENDYKLHIEARPLELDESLRRLLAGRQIGFWDTFKPRGRANVVLDMSQKGGQSKAVYRAVVEPLDCELSFSGRDYPLGRTRGKLILEPGRTTLESLAIVRDPVEIKVDGELLEAPDRQAYNLRLQTQSLLCDDTLFKALPEPVQFIHSQMDMEGRIDADLEVGYLREGGESGRWKIQGAVQVRDGVVHQPMLTDNIDGSLAGQAFYDGKTQQFNLTGKATCSRVRVKDRLLQSFTGQLSYDGEQNILTIADMSGDFCGGRLAGQAQTLLSGNPPGFKLDLMFRDVQLDQLMPPRKSDKPETVKPQGLFQGRFSMIQTGGEETRHGNFAFQITQAVLGAQPITSQLLNLFNWAQPREGAFNEATVIGDIAGLQTRFETILLKGSSGALNGAGVMTSPDNQLDLVFVTDSSRDLQVPVVSSFINAIKPGLMQVRVRGTFDEPVVEPVALPAIDDALKELGGQSSSKQPSHPLPAPESH